LSFTVSFMAGVDDDNERAHTLRAERDPNLDEETYVLVVEDDADIRNAVVEALELEGYHVRQAVNGKDALTILDTEFMLGQIGGGKPRVPSAILLDLMMPVMSGTEFYAVVRHQRPQFAHVRFVIMSADPNVRDFEWVVSTANLEPAEGILPKPFNVDDLLRKVRKAIGE